MLRNTIQGLKNLIYWFPVIWKDRDWDRYFLYKMIERKLARMEQFFQNDSHYTGADKDARNIRTCKLLLQRLIAEDYDNMLDIEWKQNNEDILPVCYGCHTLWWTGKRWTLYMNYMIEQDLDLLFKIIRKQIRRWWD